MIHHQFFDEYKKLWKKGKINLNVERIKLLEVLEREILTRDDIYFDETMISNFVKFTEKNFFPLTAYQKFIVPFIFLFDKDSKEPYFNEFFINVARGGGKNGFMSARDAFFVGPLYPVKNYDVTITANSEKQGKVSFKEVYEIIQERGLDNHYYLTKMAIVGRKNNSTFQFRTNNPKTMDSARDGCLEFDEIHQFESSRPVDVQRSGLGKVPHPRTFYNGTNGYVRGGFFDKLMERSLAILNGETKEFRLFPFICRLDNAKEMNDMKMWDKANPMLDENTPYAKRLFNETKDQFLNLELEPSGRQEFMTKRMNLPEADLEKDVTSHEKLMATDTGQAIDLTGKNCVAGFDYASIRDFASVGLLFKIEGKFLWKQHTFARKEFLDAFKLRAPIYDWQKDGLVTVVDEPSIDPQHLVDWLNEQREHYQIDLVVADGFRMDLLKPILERNGYEYEFIRNIRGVQSKVAPIVEDGFANERFMFPSDPMMRWYTNNTYISEDSQGNRTFLKKEQVRRKTDGFHAFLAALYKRELLQDFNIDEELDLLDFDF